MVTFSEAFPIISLDDVDRAVAFYSTTFASGAEEVLAPTDRPWGERMCSFRDTDGHLIHIGARA